MPPPQYPTHAMILAAGRGARMRPLTLTTPKPLVQVGGRVLLDRALDALETTEVKQVVINIHHLGEQIINHLASQQHRPFDIIISDEREALLDSAGGVIKALPHLGDAPFFILNADTFWHDVGVPTLQRLATAFDASSMDMLLLTVERDQAAFPERGDFLYDVQGQPPSRLHRAAPNRSEAVIYGGALMVHPRVFHQAQPVPHSLNHYFDQAIAGGKLFGLPLVGHWYTLTTAHAIATVEKLLLRHENKSE